MPALERVTEKLEACAESPSSPSADTRKFAHPPQEVKPPVLAEMPAYDSSSPTWPEESGGPSVCEETEAEDFEEDMRAPSRTSLCMTMQVRDNLPKGKRNVFRADVDKSLAR